VTGYNSEVMKTHGP